MSKITSHLALLAATGALLVTSACSGSHDKKDVEKGHLTRSFTLIDKQDGRLYGNVEMDPVGGGKIFDADGRLIGNIVPPPPAGYAPVPPAYGYAPPPPPTR